MDFFPFLLRHGVRFRFAFDAFIWPGRHFRIFLCVYHNVTKWWFKGLQQNEPPRRYEHVVTLCVCVCVCVCACAVADCSIMRA